jgi:hypothetical protein
VGGSLELLEVTSEVFKYLSLLPALNYVALGHSQVAPDAAAAFMQKFSQCKDSTDARDPIF